MGIQLINNLAIKWIGYPAIEKFRLSMMHTSQPNTITSDILLPQGASAAMVELFL